MPLGDCYHPEEALVVPQQLQQSKSVQGVESRNMTRESGVLLEMTFVASVTTRDAIAVSTSPRLWQLLSSTWTLHSWEQ